MIKYSFTVQTAKPNARQKAERLQAASMDIPQADCPVEHHFAPGVWARQITIPAGVTLVGAVHKVDNFAVLLSGKLLMVTDDGTQELNAPQLITVKAGQKNAALALETATWINFWGNPDNEKDLNNLIESVCESNACELLGGAMNKQLLTSGSEKEIACH